MVLGLHSSGCSPQSMTLHSFGWNPCEAEVQVFIFKWNLKDRDSLLLALGSPMLCSADRVPPAAVIFGGHHSFIRSEKVCAHQDKYRWPSLVPCMSVWPGNVATIQMDCDDSLFMIHVVNECSSGSLLCLVFQQWFHPVLPAANSSVLTSWFIPDQLLPSCVRRLHQ